MCCCCLTELFNSIGHRFLQQPRHSVCICKSLCSCMLPWGSGTSAACCAHSRSSRRCKSASAAAGPGVASGAAAAAARFRASANCRRRVAASSAWRRAASFAAWCASVARCCAAASCANQGKNTLFRLRSEQRVWKHLPAMEYRSSEVQHGFTTSNERRPLPDRFQPQVAFLSASLIFSNLLWKPRNWISLHASCAGPTFEST